MSIESVHSKSCLGGSFKVQLLGALSRGSLEGPVAGGDVAVVSQDDGAGEDVEGVLLDPLVVVALVKLVALRRVPEESGPLADLGADGVVEAPVAAGTELGVVRPLELLEDGGRVLDGRRDAERPVAAGLLGLAGDGGRGGTSERTAAAAASAAETGTAAAAAKSGPATVASKSRRSASRSAISGASKSGRSASWSSDAIASESRRSAAGPSVPVPSKSGLSVAGSESWTSDIACLSASEWG